MNLDDCSLIIITAYTADLLWGDPRWFPHPVKGIGWLITTLEPLFRKMIKWEKIAGLLLTTVIVSGIWGITSFMVSQAVCLNPSIGMLLSIILIYTSLSIKDLKVESMLVYAALKNSNLQAARKNLGLIVGRDTQNLQEKEIIKATLETIAENSVDGIISPLFFAFIGGAPLALSYKAVNTLDSMIGYQNKKYKKFGWAAAKLDDLVNFIPARLAIFLLSLASFAGGYKGHKAFSTACRDGHKNPSPNSGLPEATLAGALELRLGGPAIYKGKIIKKPYLGDNINPLSRAAIKKALLIVYIASFLSVTIGMVLRWIIS